MELIFAIYGAITIFFIFFLYQLLLNPTGKHKAPPKAGGARPFTGHLHVIGGGSSTTLPHINLATLADKHGPIFRIRLGVNRAVVVSSWELAKELFTTHDVAISSRPMVRSTKYLSYDLAVFGFTPYGSYWQQLRKVVASELLAARKIELQRNVRVSETMQSINELYRVYEEKNDGSGKVLLDMKRWLGDLSLNVILRLVVGKRFHCRVDAEQTRRCREVMRDFFHLAGLFLPADAFPFLGWLDFGGYEKKMKQTGEELDKILGGWLAEHREMEYSGEDCTTQNFMGVMQSVVDGANLQGKYDVDTIIKATCQVLISGGTDTTAVMLIWAISLILNNRHVLKKTQEELDEQVGRERRVNESDINNLVYLQAVVQETLRLYPAGPLGGIREFSKDCFVGGYHVPKGTWLLVNLWKLHRDPQVWPDDPLEFKPERFLSRQKDVDVKGQDFELIPFGAGRRICPGANFGLHMLHLVLASLLQAFDLSTINNEKVDMTESAGLTNLKATPLDVLVAPRLSPSLYLSS
ncbi:hypothetical protein C2S53_009638 [Perilla frutescens var. hirtella]|uniref:Flavonoid-6-hydroxylase n=1 Tax=Perilla frutescens var. hirtella TaxID=608512 RepID=A0AAD4ING4_PERFH|nr:hypothetical protein C2S53_009638 [Perilla frutescens var. hirtella]